MNPTMLKLTGKLFIFWKRHGATISIATGAVGLVSAGVVGAIQWVKCKRLIDECTQDLDRIDETVGNTVVINGEEHVYSEEDANKDRSATKRKAVFGCARNLAAPLGLALGSSGVIFYGVRDFKKQIASGLAYASSLEQVIAQRDAIFRKEFGDEKVDMLYKGYRTEQVEHVEVDEATGVNKVTIEDQLRKEFDITPDNILVFKFGYGCDDWRAGDRVGNIDKVKFANSSWNSYKAIKSFATGCDVLECTGIPYSRSNGAAQIVGCVYDTSKSSEENYITWDIVEDDSDEITFVVKFDGIILDKIGDVTKGNNRKLKRYA